MSSFINHGHDCKITIPRTEETEKCTNYEINIKIGDVHWTVTHRYSDFVELHEILSSDHGVTKDLLPPKKIIRNKDPVFIEKRRLALEMYLSTIIRYLQKTMPRQLALFLDFHEYDIAFLLQNLSLQLFRDGDQLLARSKSFCFNPLQLHSISWRLKQPCPQLEVVDQKQSFSHVLEYCQQLYEIIIKGNNKKIKTSNIIPNNLVFELSAFKILEKLTLIQTNVNNIAGVGMLRSTLKVLNCCECIMPTMASMFLCDNIHKDLNHLDSYLKWNGLVEVNMANNELTEIDQSLVLVPNLERLNLENNNITTINNLGALKHLKYLNLSNNKLTTVENLSNEIPKINYLDLSQNGISVLSGFVNLQQLETLDIKSNAISDIEEVQHLINLPNLENIVLTGNPLSVVVDYRIKVLEQFEHRSAYICLDNEKSTQKELDKVAVLQAIRMSKQFKSLTAS